jgi:transposase InsO family protein
VKRKFKATAHGSHGLPVAPDLRERRLTVVAPKRVWAADIATVWAGDKWCDRPVVIDLFCRQMVGFAMRERMTLPLVIDGSWPGSMDDPRTP